MQAKATTPIACYRLALKQQLPELAARYHVKSLKGRIGQRIEHEMIPI